MSPRLLRPKTRATGFDPRSIADLGIWLDAGDVSSLAQNSAGTTAVTANNDPVGYWRDRIGGYAFTQTVAEANRPLWVASAIGGKPALSFDGSNDFLALTSGAGLDVLRNVPGATLVVACRFATLNVSITGFSQVLFVQRNGATTSRGNLALQTSGVISSGGRRLDADVFVSVISSASAISATTNYVLTGALNYTTGVARVFRNGTVLATNNSFHSGGNTSDTASNAVIIGAQDTAAANPANVSIAEALIYRRVISDAELSALHNYLQSKYGI
jgi:hypothetical protein